MALTGLRPAREVKNDSVAGVLSGAYQVFVQDTLDGAAQDQKYFMAKWLRLAAGTYRLRFICDDLGHFKLDGAQVAQGTHGGSWSVPAEVTFNVAANGVYRWDVDYVNGPAGSPGYAAYELSKDGVVIEVSRAQDFVADLIQIPDSALGPKPPYDTDVRLSYPVFLAKPDWKSGVLERLEWLTDVMTSESGAEQRRMLRQYPRRSVEASFLMHGRYRALIDSYITGVGQTNGLLPLWWDETPVDTSYAGAVDIFGDFARREFFVNDVVIVRLGTGLWDYELNIVAGKPNAGHLVLRYGLQHDLPESATITPVRVARILEQMSGTMLTDEVRQFQMRFQTLEAADYTTAWTFPIYKRTNLPILTWQGNYRENASLTYDRNVYQWDNQVGNIYSVDPGATSVIGDRRGYQVHGREQMHEFKSNIYKMAGRLKEFHMPTGHDEFELSRDPNESSGALVVYRSGYSQYDTAQQPVRRDILIELYDGTLWPNTIISTRVLEDEEWLFLSETIPSVPKEQVRRISYMPRSRLDIDAVEINHLADADGVSQVSLTYKAIAERRDAPPIQIE